MSMRRCWLVSSADAGTKVNKGSRSNLRKHTANLVNQGILSVITLKVDSWVPVDGLVLSDLTAGTIRSHKLIVTSRDTEA